MKTEWYFGSLPDGRKVHAYQLGAPDGLRVIILNHGATLQSVYLPNGHNVVLGFETLEAYLSDKSYIGKIIGRNANRIADARFEIDGKAFELSANETSNVIHGGPNNLHGGTTGFDQFIWDASLDEDILVLSHFSPDGDEGFPGDLSVTLRISVTGTTLRLEMEAETSRPTPVNLTWHPYWNFLAKSRIDGHDLQISSNQRTALRSRRAFAIENTRYDFQTPLPLGSIKLDENYVETEKVVLSTLDTHLTVTSSLPDMHVYTGDGLPSPRSGIAIEPQFRPNDINFDQDSILNPGETYRHWIEYQFEMS